MTKENYNHVAYLDLNIFKHKGNVEIDIYKKPTTTDVVMDNNLCHPGELKITIFKSLLHRLQNLPLYETNKAEELNTIITVAKSNEYKNEQINLYKQMKNKKCNRHTNSET
jgi:hypothetical protein